MQKSLSLKRWLETAPRPFFVAFAIAAAFSTYFCMYAFRKPFSVASFQNLQFFGTEIDLKTAIVISQVFGYALSKYLGIKFCSEITRERRAIALVGLIAFAELALVVFAIVPNNVKPFVIFFNGLPLGMVWGMVVWYLEGRRTSEFLMAGLSCSYILSSGVVKDVGRNLLQTGVSEDWMPALTGLCFLAPYLLAVYLLNQLPDPTKKDEEARTHRQPMHHKDRLAFVKHFALGLVMLFTVYFFLTAYRDFRDNFGIEICTQLGLTAEYTNAMFTRSEIWVMAGVATTLACLNLIRNNRYGLLATFGVMFIGVMLLTVATLLLQQKMIDPLTWMILTGLGSYLAYVPFGSVVFDRVIASTRVAGTAVFAIYLADALGYTGSVAIMLGKDMFVGDMSRLDFFISLTYFMSTLGGILLCGSAIYFFACTDPKKVDRFRKVSVDPETEVKAVAQNYAAAESLEKQTSQ